MREIALLLAFCVLTTTLVAQNPALNVPKFKGIVMTGTVDQFGSKLSSQGFEFLGKEDYGSMYMGRFAGMNDCIVVLVSAEKSNDIAAVNVLVGLKISGYEVYSYETWEKLLGDYEDLKELLTKKYGEPTKQNARFTQDAIASSSFFKLHAVKEGQCEYYTTWGDSDVDKMVVQLSIKGGKSMGLECAIIALQYLNVDKVKDSQKEILDDL